MPGGRPPIFKNNKELEEKINNYFEQAADPKPYTITGLALHLGFSSRQSLYDYESNEEFSYTIKKARTTIEQFYEENLLSKNATGAIFALKNFGWKDKIIQENEGSIDLNITRKIISGDKS